MHFLTCLGVYFSHLSPIEILNKLCREVNINKAYYGQFDTLPKLMRAVVKKVVKQQVWYQDRWVSMN